jgi:hypothetical protein
VWVTERHAGADVPCFGLNVPRFRLNVPCFRLNVHCFGLNVQRDEALEAERRGMQVIEELTFPVFVCMFPVLV